jgi:Domain of unknown function (DUF1772)
MPMLQMPEVPVRYAGQQTAYLLHNRYVMPDPSIQFRKKIHPDPGGVGREAVYANHEIQSGSQLTDNGSEHFFPPLNAACTLSNVIATIIAYLNHNSHSVAASKLPYLCLATAANIATTAYALLIMVPMNRKQVAIAERLKDKENELEERDFRRLQKKWMQLNYGRATIMIAGSVAGMMGLLVHHA